jgi:hypothetical protein
MDETLLILYVSPSELSKHLLIVHFQFNMLWQKKTTK